MLERRMPLRPVLSQQLLGNPLVELPYIDRFYEPRKLHTGRATCIAEMARTALLASKISLSRRLAGEAAAALEL
jgi:hypothetical protein